jgi:hypothetical protein
MKQVFSAVAKSDLGAVRRALPKAVCHDPTWLWNLGVISTAMEAILGKHMAHIVRRGWRAISTSKE